MMSGKIEVLPKYVICVLGTLVTAILGATLRGDIVLIIVQLYKIATNQDEARQTEEESHIINEEKNQTYDFGSNMPLEQVGWKERWYLQNVETILVFSLVASFISYYSMAGFMQYYFYYKRKDEAHEWKCQPKRWLTPSNERHEILLGSFNMLLGATLSGILATYILNGGPCKLYYGALDKGPIYLVVSTVLLFLMQDGGAYYMHRMSHIPFFYKLYHKMHHRYTCPTAFSAVSMHPMEFLTYQCILAAPIFCLPIYSGAFLCVVIYNYYYGMMDHSGVKMNAIWPWQPPTMFHDNHHKLFHVNFGFNSYIWDWLHDTLRKETRTYGENIYGGKGITNSGVTKSSCKTE